MASGMTEYGYKYHPSSWGYNPVYKDPRVRIPKSKELDVLAKTLTTALPDAAKEQSPKLFGMTPGQLSLITNVAGGVGNIASRIADDRRLAREERRLEKEKRRGSPEADRLRTEGVLNLAIQGRRARKQLPDAQPNRTGDLGLALELDRNLMDAETQLQTSAASLDNEFRRAVEGQLSNIKGQRAGLVPGIISDVASVATGLPISLLTDMQIEQSIADRNMAREDREINRAMQMYNLQRDAFKDAQELRLIDDERAFQREMRGSFKDRQDAEKDAITLEAQLRAKEKQREREFESEQSEAERKTKRYLEQLKAETRLEQERISAKADSTKAAQKKSEERTKRASRAAESDFNTTISNIKKSYFGTKRGAIRGTSINRTPAYYNDPSNAVERAALETELAQAVERIIQRNPELYENTDEQRFQLMDEMMFELGLDPVPGSQ